MAGESRNFARQPESLVFRFYFAQAASADLGCHLPPPEARKRKGGPFPPQETPLCLKFYRNIRTQGCFGREEPLSAMVGGRASDVTGPSHHLSEAGRRAATFASVGGGLALPNRTARGFLDHWSLRIALMRSRRKIVKISPLFQKAIPTPVTAPRADERYGELHWCCAQRLEPAGADELACAVIVKAVGPHL